MPKYHTIPEDQAINAAIAYKLAIKNGEEDNYLDEQYAEFGAQWDYNDKPSVSAKRHTSFTKYNYVDHAWNQFLAVTEAQNEYVRGLNANDTFSNMTVLDQMEAFLQWMHYYVETLRLQAKDNGDFLIDLNDL